MHFIHQSSLGFLFRLQQQECLDGPDVPPAQVEPTPVDPAHTLAVNSLDSLYDLNACSFILTEGIKTRVSPVTDVFGQLWRRFCRPRSRTGLVVEKSTESNQSIPTALFSSKASVF